MYLWYSLYNRHNKKSMNLKKYDSKYKNMQKWMIEFPRKFENRGTKITLVNSILIKNLSIYS